MKFFFLKKKKFNIIHIFFVGSGSGRPRPSPCLVHFSYLISKSVVPAYLTVGNGEIEPIQFEGSTKNSSIIPPPLPESLDFDNGVSEIGGAKVPLIRLAW